MHFFVPLVASTVIKLDQLLYFVPVVLDLPLLLIVWLHGVVLETNFNCHSTYFYISCFEVLTKLPYLFEYNAQNFVLIFNQKLRVRVIHE